MNERNWLWDLMGFFYDRFFENFPPYQKLLRDVIENFRISSVSSTCFLDAGCGTGNFSIELAKLGLCGVGIDHSAKMVDRARKKKEKQKLHTLSFIKEDLNDEISLEDYRINRILFIHSLFIMDDPNRTLKNLIIRIPQGAEILMCNPYRRISKKELLSAGRIFAEQVIRKKGLWMIFYIGFIAMGMGILNLIIQHRKNRIYHYWDEKEIATLLQNCGVRIKWLRKSCLADSHILLCGVKE